MDPATPPPIPNETQQPMQPVQPQQPINPVAMPAQPAVVPPQSLPMQPEAPVNGKSKLVLLIVIGAGIAIFILAAIVAYFMFLSPAALSKKASSDFMSAVTTGDKQKLYTLGNATTEEDKVFFDNSVEAVKGSYNLIQNTAKEDRWYFLYSLSNGTKKFARTTVEKQDGKWRVIGFVFSDKELLLIPNDSKQSDDSKPVSSSTEQKCLVASDFDPWYLERYNSTATSQGFRFDLLETAFINNVHFNPDSTNIYDGNISGIEDMIVLAKSVSTKDFKIRLKGSVGTTLKSDLDFANQRAESVKAKLITEGVDVNKIVIDPPENVADTTIGEITEVDKRRSRAVVLKFDPTCESDSTSTTQSER